MRAKRIWVTGFPSSNGQRTVGVNISMRFDKKEWDGSSVPDPVHLRVDEFRANKEDPTLEKHLVLGMLDEESLVILREAIDDYLRKVDRQADDPYRRLLDPPETP